MGRPKKEAADRRSAPIMVKLTPAERDRLAAEVRRVRAPSLASLVRERALTGTVTTRSSRELAAADRVALTRIGVNLNQIARIANMSGVPALAEMHDRLSSTLARINAVLEQGDDDGPESH